MKNLFICIIDLILTKVTNIYEINNYKDQKENKR